MPADFADSNQIKAEVQPLRQTFQPNKIMELQTLRVNRDSNGNSRMVVHFLAFNTREELDRTGDEWIPVSQKYAIALKRANAYGGRKFHNKQFGGGIVFQASTEKQIEEIVKMALADAEAKFQKA